MIPSPSEMAAVPAPSGLPLEVAQPAPSEVLLVLHPQSLSMEVLPLLYEG